MDAFTTGVKQMMLELKSRTLIIFLSQVYTLGVTQVLSKKIIWRFIVFPQGYDFRKQEKKEVPVDDSKLVGRKETLGRYKGVEL